MSSALSPLSYLSRLHSRSQRKPFPNPSVHHDHHGGDGEFIRPPRRGLSKNAQLSFIRRRVVRWDT
jgi:hypothetical protein